MSQSPDHNQPVPPPAPMPPSWSGYSTPGTTPSGPGTAGPQAQTGAPWMPQYPAAGQFTPAVAGGHRYAPVAAPPEMVGRGIGLALLAIPVGVLVTDVIARLGFISAISSLVLSGLALFLYIKGAGTVPRKGVIPLIAVIVVGLIMCFMSMIAMDSWAYASSPEGADLGMTGPEAAVAALVTPQVYAAYAKDALFFVVFAVFGGIGVLRRVAGRR